MDHYVQITEISKIEEHPNADRLEIAYIGGWKTIVQKNKFNVGDDVVFFPPDSILVESLHTHLGITNYCAEIKNSENKRRVRATRLRSITSYGTIAPVESIAEYFRKKQNNNTINELDIHSWYAFDQEGFTTRLLEVEHYEPPVKISTGDNAKECQYFHTYTKIKHWRDYPNVLKEDDEIVITSKIHGTLWMAGLCEDDYQDFILMAGSHHRRKKSGEGLYWQPLQWYPQIQDLLEKIHLKTKKSVIIFGEIYGSGVQKMTYGLQNGKKDLRVFDISVDGVYINYKEMLEYCQKFDIPVVPGLYIGKYSAKIVEDFTDGPVVICKPEEVVGKFKGREGVVIKPIKERYSEEMQGRVILKSVSADYLALH